jgi:hypothetical protein
MAIAILPAEGSEGVDSTPRVDSGRRVKPSLAATRFQKIDQEIDEKQAMHETIAREIKDVELRMTLLLTFHVDHCGQRHDSRDQGCQATAARPEDDRRRVASSTLK